MITIIDIVGKGSKTLYFPMENQVFACKDIYAPEL